MESEGQVTNAKSSPSQTQSAISNALPKPEALKGVSVGGGPERHSQLSGFTKVGGWYFLLYLGTVTKRKYDITCTFSMSCYRQDEKLLF